MATTTSPRARAQLGRDAAAGLRPYFCEIAGHELLTAAEERTLAAAIARGDRDARSRMIQANLRLVVRIARDYVGRGIVFDDLIGEGNLGLIRAAEEFDPRFGARFSTYASYWIKEAICHALTNTTATIRLPAHMVGLLTKWRWAKQALVRELAREPTFDEIASSLGLSEAQKTLMARAQQARRVQSMGKIVAKAGRWSPHDLIDSCETPVARLDTDEECGMVLRRMGRLTDRERTVLALRYGLEGESPFTHMQIARRLGITREGARKVELRALSKLDDR